MHPRLYQSLHCKLSEAKTIMAAKTENISILMFPWLAYGHISPFFQLAKKLSLKNFQIYFCSTQVNLKHIRDNFYHESDLPYMQLIDIELPSSFQELPSHYHTTKDLPPHLMNTLKVAFDQAKSAFCNILNNLKPHLVIYDIFQPWVPASASELNIKAVLFYTSAAATCSFLIHVGTSLSLEFPSTEFSLPESEIQKLSLLIQEKANGICNFDRCSECMRGSSTMVLIKTARDIEAKYIDHLSELVGQEMVTVGPLVQEPAYHDDDEYIINWLSSKDSCSVVYVSFGSEYFLSKEEMEEIANGLELSQANFIWVVRFHQGEKMTIHETLPQGFSRRVEERGLVVEGWAPQAKILSHSSIGGFVSHCGWSSTLEGMVFGVPIIAMPMHLDQPLNAKLVVEIGVGMEVQRKDEKIDREELAKVINKVMAKEEGEQVKRRAKELSEKLKEKGDEEMDGAVEKLLKLVKGSIIL